MKRYPNPKLMMFVLLLAVTLLAIALGRLPKVGAAPVPNPTCTMNPVVTSGGDAGPNTLRQAVADACPGSTINNFITTISLTSGQITIDKNLTIQGSTISVIKSVAAAYTATNRIFFVNEGVTASLIGLNVKDGKVTVEGAGIYNNGTLTVEGVTLTNNRVTGNGGGIYNNGILTVINSTIIDNGLPSISGGPNYRGGGIYNHGALTVSGSTISNNHSSGAGIYNEGMATVTYSVFSGNQGDDFISEDAGAITNKNATLNVSDTIFDGNGGRTGGICNAFISTANVTVTNSTFKNNHGQFGPGGIWSRGTTTVTGTTFSDNEASYGFSDGGGAIQVAGGTFTLTNSTVSNNSAFPDGEGGGGIGVTGAPGGGTVNIINSTITKNLSGQNPPGVPGRGGGIFQSSTLPSTVNVRNSIIAGNTAASGRDYAGTLNSQGYNIIGSNSSTTITGDTTGNIVGVDARLAPLADNGGPTETHALLPGSPAIDKGNSFGASTDQRDIARPFDLLTLPNATGGDGADIGAFEVQFPTASDSEIAGIITTSDGTPLGGVVLHIGGTTATFTITDSAGHYRFADLDTGGFYTVTPQLVNYGFSPGARSFSLAGNTTEAVFTAVPDDVARANPLDTPEYFVRQQYLDFLGREPDQAGLAYWVDQLNTCNGEASCLRARRIAVSNAFFHEQEYQRTGSYVFRLYRAAFGNSQAHPNPDSANPTEAKKLPRYAAFAVDRGRVIGGATLAQSQLALANAFVQRREFADRYPANLDGPGFVDALLTTIRNDSGADLSTQRLALIDLYNAGGRGNVLYRLADDNSQTNPVDNSSFIDLEYNRAFVFTQYAGYLRRDADINGFRFWLGQVDSAPLRDTSKQHGMVCAFISSDEYQFRFSPVRTQSNADCH